MDCSGPQPKVLIQTSSGKVALLLDQPDRVVISGLNTATVDMNCGRQKSAQVSMQYESSTQGAVKGSVRTIRFEPADQPR